MEYKGTQTLEFSQPMGNVFLAFVSMNYNNYTFSQDFVIDSQGCGYWGCGVVNRVVQGPGQYALVWISGEPHGVIGFNGTFSSFTFNSTTDEDWNGITVGTYGLAADVYPPIQPTGCVDYLVEQFSQSTDGCCPIPSLYCVKLLNAIPEAAQADPNCYMFNKGSAQFTLSKPGQKVYLSSDSKGSQVAYFDEVAIIGVRSPSGKLRGGNYISWVNDCHNTSYPDVILARPAGTPSNDITNLFGGETGIFNIGVTVWDKYSPYGNGDTWICSGSTIGSGVSGLVEENTKQKKDSDISNGVSPQMTALIAVGASIGTAVVIIGIMIVAGYSLVKKSNDILPELQEKLSQ